MENSRIIDERKKLGLSQAELASKLKVSQKVLANMNVETGDHHMKHC